MEKEAAIPSQKRADTMTLRALLGERFDHDTQSIFESFPSYEKFSITDYATHVRGLRVRQCMGMWHVIADKNSGDCPFRQAGNLKCMEQYDTPSLDDGRVTSKDLCRVAPATRLQHAMFFAEKKQQIDPSISASWSNTIANTLRDLYALDTPAHTASDRLDGKVVDDFWKQFADVKTKAELGHSIGHCTSLLSKDIQEIAEEVHAVWHQIEEDVNSGVL